MGVSKKLEAAVGMGAATTFVLTLGSGASYLIEHYLLGPDLAYLTTLSFHRGNRRHRSVHRDGGAENQSGAVPDAGHLPSSDHHQLRGAGHPLLNVQAKHNFMESLFFGMGGALASRW